jgi:hypothetical protein
MSSPDEITGAVRGDWVAWHRAYDDPESRLSQRLELVRGRLRDALSACPPGPIRLVSLCAGQGRDVFGVLEDHPRRGDVTGRLVELDPHLARDAAAAAARLGRSVTVVRADAGAAASLEGAVPAEVVLACGIFGNVTEADIRHTIESLPQLCAPGATVIWTRHREAPDLTPTICEWFAGAGFDLVGLDGPANASIGVGTHRLAGPPQPFDPANRFFTFTDRR